MLAEYTHWIKQYRRIASLARSALLTFYEAKSMLEGRIIPQVTYSMSLTTFTKLQCKSMNIVIDRTSMNYPNFQIIQDQKGILFLLQQLQWQGTIANDLLTVLSAIQLVSGLYNPLLKDTTTMLHYMNQGRFTNMRRRLAVMNASFWIEHQWSPAVQHHNGESLMHTFSHIPGITKGKLSKANWCRVYARIITISDIADIKGNIIPGSRMGGQWQSAYVLQWP